MRATAILAGVLFLLPPVADAASTISVANMSCSGAQTSSLVNFLSLNCTGDLSLIGGTLASDSKIVLTASGSLTLDNLLVSAPQIDLTANTMTLGSGASFNAGNSMNIYAPGNSSTPAITSAAGGSISIGGVTYPIVAGSGSVLQINNSGRLVGNSQNVFMVNTVAVMPVAEPNIGNLMPLGFTVIAMLTRKRRALQKTQGLPSISRA
ncbi:MAG: hypothetical protein K2P57_04615 [Burkholderiales bacterium]|nr:hypothetical protein [Burkholderiales bacterium]